MLKTRPIIKQFTVCVFLAHWMGFQAFGLDPIAILAPSDVPPDIGNDFGWSVAISGDYIAVGAPRDPWFNGSAKGAVYVFRRLGPTWVEQAKITALDGSQNDQLGYSVAMDGDVIVAGAPHWIEPFPDNGGPGAIYVFRRHDNGTPNNPWDDTWPQEAKLTVDRDPDWALLGYSVAVSGDVIVGGRPYPCNLYLGSGEVFRRELGQWGHETSLFGSDPQPCTVGWSVDIDGDGIVLGADRYDGRGAAYVFGYNGIEWVEEAKLMALDRMAGDGLGKGVSITGNNVIAGAPGVDDLRLGPNSNTGAAYVFAWSPAENWEQQGKLTVFDGQDLTRFGSRISCDSDLCLIARQGWGESWGYLFQRVADQWVEGQRLRGPEYPYSISLAGKHAIIYTHVYVVRDRKDLRDFAVFQNCFGGCAEAPACRELGISADGNVDLLAFEKFTATFGGP
jgi:hypothetical protein